MFFYCISKIAQCWQMSSKLFLHICGHSKHIPPRNLLSGPKQGYVYWLPDYTVWAQHFWIRKCVKFVLKPCMCVMISLNPLLWDTYYNTVAFVMLINKLWLWSYCCVYFACYCSHLPSRMWKWRNLYWTEHLQLLWGIFWSHMCSRYSKDP